MNVGTQPFKADGNSDSRRAEIRVKRVDNASFSRHAVSGFTLIELLVVFSIIALLASLTVGLTSVASRKSKEARVRGELHRLATAIDNYKARLGHYPPDNPGKPSTNQLFYELSGTVYDGNFGFEVYNSPQRIRTDTITAFFNALGFANSILKAHNTLETTGRQAVESDRNRPFGVEFKGNQYREVDPTMVGNSVVNVLVVPVPGPDTLQTLDAYPYAVGRPAPQLPLRWAKDPPNRRTINPWLYDSSSRARNNRGSYDLWCEVVINKKIIRFSNWEKEPVVLGEIR